MFTVTWIDSYMGGRRFRRSFDTEQQARQFINSRVDGTVEFLLFDRAGELIVRSPFPVLMVA